MRKERATSHFCSTPVNLFPEIMMTLHNPERSILWPAERGKACRNKKHITDKIISLKYIRLLSC